MRRLLPCVQQLTFIEKSSIKPDKWLVLGDMLELGEHEKQYHEEMSASISDGVFKGICLFGPKMEWLYDKLQSNLTWKK